MKLEQAISRRDFLKLSGYVAGAAMLPTVKPAANLENKPIQLGKSWGGFAWGSIVPGLT